MSVMHSLYTATLFLIFAAWAQDEASRSEVGRWASPPVLSLFH
jgi:hypothetical protein